ncbi:MAG: TetR/AcrR family transcriptional regulator [Streptococcaceae bacterium]|jgi:AcrR family transcriptional regulator|nr:TetR/AcrR family transcriptional regulator [Streptococcaceae bacterium]MCH4178087.1 TetR/AcrR family transcriptional regulator [Streptococcaceae bacterium]
MLTKTQFKIIEAFKRLIIENGYSKTTTKRIAELAGVNESTIFKNFKDKEGLMNAAVDQFLIEAVDITKDLEMSGDVEKDLINLSRRYQEFVASHQAIVLAGFRETFEISKLNEAVQRVPIHFKKLLIAYFEELQSENRISSSISIESEVMNVIWLNFGYFLTKNRFQDSSLDYNLDYFLENNIRNYASKLTFRE